jgi:microcystin-dependent protein
MFTDAYMANVTIFAGNFAPQGYMLCQGQLLDIATYNALFALLGTTFGGDGQNTFALPDLRGRKPIHTGQGPGLGYYDLGQTGGVEQATITGLQMPINTHQFISANGAPLAFPTAGNQNTPVNNVPAALAGGHSGYATAASGTVLGSSSTPAVTPIAGSSQPIDIRSPYMAMNYIIAVEGIFPSRN